MDFFNSIYYKLNKKTIDRAILKLKKIPIDVVYDIITKNCWKYGIQYEIILKNRNELELKLMGQKEIVVLKFHKTLVVFKEDYDRVLAISDYAEANKCYYITTGVFNAEVLKLNLWRMDSLKLKLLDNFKFIKTQIWIRKEFRSHMQYKKLDFTKYLPM